MLKEDQVHIYLLQKNQILAMVRMFYHNHERSRRNKFLFTIYGSVPSMLLFTSATGTDDLAYFQEVQSIIIGDRTSSSYYRQKICYLWHENKTYFQ